METGQRNPVVDIVLQDTICIYLICRIQDSVRGEAGDVIEKMLQGQSGDASKYMDMLREIRGQTNIPGKKYTAIYSYSLMCTWWDMFAVVIRVFRLCYILQTFFLRKFEDSKAGDTFALARGVPKSNVKSLHWEAGADYSRQFGVDAVLSTIARKCWF